MRVVTTDEMSAIDKVAITEYGYNESLIIENVGLQGAQWMEENILSGEFTFGEIIFLIGPGNNGADGLAIARHLKNLGYIVRAFMLFTDEKASEELKKQFQLARSFGVNLSEISKADELSSYFEQTQDEYLVVDAILGLGLRLPVSNYLFDVINIANAHSTVSISIDMPTGVTGQGTISGNAIEADFTLAIGLPKTGHFIGEGAKHSGILEVIDAGFPTELLAGGDKRLLFQTSPHIEEALKNRNKFAHKNTFGHTLTIGGSRGMTGALIMASTAALKVGTGLVTASTWENCYPEMCSRIAPEIITGLIPTEHDGIESRKKELEERWDSIVIGPGMGRSEHTRKIVLEVLGHYAGPVVVDADAINALDLKRDAGVIASRKFPTILTPHMGEFAAFIGEETEKVLERPLDYLKEVVDACNCSIVLKGSCSYLGFPSGQFYINYFPNDGMASGGSGDVLAGILGGLLAQNTIDRERSGIFVDKEKIYGAVCLGVVAHSIAGKHAANKHGVRAMTAGSIIDHLSDAFSEIESEEQR